MKLTNEERKTLWGGLQLAQIALARLITALEKETPVNVRLLEEARRRQEGNKKLLKKLRRKGLNVELEIE